MAQRIYNACRLHRVVDGDTVYVEIDHGFQSIRSTQDLRLRHVNTPERGQPEWTAATQVTIDWFQTHASASQEWPFTVVTYRTDVHGRFEAVVIHTESGHVLNDTLRERWPA
jgi:endonuclease YncB( thermonuclease family)